MGLQYHYHYHYQVPHWHWPRCTWSVCSRRSLELLPGAIPQIAAKPTHKTGHRWDITTLIDISHPTNSSKTYPQNWAQVRYNLMKSILGRGWGIPNEGIPSWNFDIYEGIPYEVIPFPYEVIPYGRIPNVGILHESITYEDIPSYLIFVLFLHWHILRPENFTLKSA